MQYDEIINHYFEQLDSGIEVDPRSVIERYPEFATRLQGFFSNVMAVHNAADDALDAGTKVDRTPKLPAKELGRFSLIRPIGSGGFGDVFLARDPVLQRNVAIKVPQSHRVLDQTVRERVLREREAAANLQHPNIVPVFEAGEQNDLLYIVSEYCEGQNLAEWIRDGAAPSEARTAARIVHKLADAVLHSHSRGILHRDIKPGNVLLPTSNESGSELPFEPRLTDFGLARIMHTPSDATQEGMLVGTLMYISPEQARGLNDELTEATDIYSLGVILYQLLTNRLPLEGKSDYERLRNLCEREPDSPSKYIATIPRDLEKVCMKCLAKEPSARYASAGELRDDLKRFLDDRPVQIATKPRFSWRLPLGIVSMGVVLLTGVALLSSSQGFRATNQEPVEVSFDGVDDHIVVPSLTWDGSHPVTIEAWVKPNSKRSCVLLTLGGIINLNLQRDHNKLQPSVGALKDTATFHLVSFGDVEMGEWIHIAGTFNGESLALFLNGQRPEARLQHVTWPEDAPDDFMLRELVEEHPKFQLSPVWPGLKFAIGGNPWAESPEWFEAFEGTISEIRVSRGVRYTEDFDPKRRFEVDDDTLALYHLDSFQQNVVKDASPNQHDGRLMRTWDDPTNE